MSKMKTVLRPASKTCTSRGCARSGSSPVLSGFGWRTALRPSLVIASHGGSVANSGLAMVSRSTATAGGRPAITSLARSGSSTSSISTSSCSSSSSGSAAPGSARRAAISGRMRSTTARSSGCRPSSPSISSTSPRQRNRHPAATRAPIAAPTASFFARSALVLIGVVAGATVIWPPARA